MRQGSKADVVCRTTAVRKFGVSNKSVSYCTGLGQCTQHGPDAPGELPPREPEMLKLAGDMFDTWADENGNPSVFAAMISVVVDQAMQRRLTRQIAEVLRRNADILDAAAASGVQRQPPQSTE